MSMCFLQNLCIFVAAWCDVSGSLDVVVCALDPDIVEAPVNLAPFRDTSCLVEWWLCREVGLPSASGCNKLAFHAT